MALYEFQVYETLLRILTEQNRRLRETAETLGVTAERLSAEVRDMEAQRRSDGPDGRHESDDNV